MNIYEQQAKNKKLTFLIMAVFIIFFLFLGLGFDYFYGTFNPINPVPKYTLNYQGYYEVTPNPSQFIPYGTIISLIFGFGMVINSVINGAGTVLRSTMARRAVSLDEKERQFLNITSEMAIAAGIPAPAAYVVPDPDLNAFATGFSINNSCIAVTEGLLKELNRGELQAVIGHEISHIRNYDMRLMTVVAALIGAIGLLSDFARRSTRFRGTTSSSKGSGGKGKGGAGILMLVLFVIWVLFILLAPLLSRILAMAISRHREYLADAFSAELTRNPLALASALEKIRAAIMPTYSVNNGVAHMCITDPRGSLIEEKLGLAADLFATHPPMEKRILALKVMAYQTAGKG